MSLRIDTTSWISGALIIGNTGGGVLAQNLASAGDNGTGFLIDDVSLPADNDKEVCGRITSWPSGLSLFAFEDGSTIASAADGVYVAQYQLYVDYVPTGVPTSLTFTFGSATCTANASWVEGAETIAVAANASLPAVLASSSWVEGDEIFTASVSVSMPAVLTSAAWVEGDETISASASFAALGVSAVATWSEGSEGVSAVVFSASSVVTAGAAWVEGDEAASIVAVSLAPTVSTNAMWVEGAESVIVSIDAHVEGFSSWTESSEAVSITLVLDTQQVMTLTQADINAIADAVWAHPAASKMLTVAKFLAYK